MLAIKKVLKVAGYALLSLACATALWLLWWHAPVSVRAAAIEKVNVPGIHEGQLSDCASFAMSPDEFRAYWKDVRPIFEFEFHDYSFGSCYFKTMEGNKEYAIGIGGVGMVTKGDNTYYYVRKNDKPDFADMK